MGRHLAPTSLRYRTESVTIGSYWAQRIRQPIPYQSHAQRWWVYVPINPSTLGPCSR